jgi:hypothetical protein
MVGCRRRTLPTAEIYVRRREFCSVREVEIGGEDRFVCSERKLGERQESEGAGALAAYLTYKETTHREMRFIIGENAIPWTPA